MKDPAALLYIDAWKSSTTEMDAITRAYYMDLILHQYDKGSLPNNIEELANICRVRFSEFKQFEQVFEQVLKHKFKQNSDGRLENDVASEIIRKRQYFLDKRSGAGKMSYFVKFVNKHFKLKKDVFEWLKNNINLEDVDMKNEQVFKHMLKQKIELYINEDEDEDVSINDIDNSIKTKEVFNFKKELINLIFDEDLVNDFMQVRKLKKSANTKTALNAIIKECEKNNFDIKEAIKICCEKSWSGFKYEWVLNLQQKTIQNGNTKTESRRNNTIGGIQVTSLAEFLGSSTDELSGFTANGGK